MTSGSTGRPKCVVQSEDAMRDACRCTVDVVGLEPDEAVGAFVPLLSVAAFCFGMHFWPISGARCVDRQVVTRCRVGGDGEASRGVDDVGPDHGPATVGHRRLRRKVVDAARDDGGRRSDERTRSTNGRGEARYHIPAGVRHVRVPRAHHAATRRPARHQTRPDGRPFEGTVVRAVDAAGNPLAAGEIGDAQVKGPSLFVGYARGGVPVPAELTADGFLPTGDLLEVAADGSIR